MWSGEHGQAKEASRWQGWATSKWAVLCTRRGGGERVKNERTLTINRYGWGGGRKEGETNNSENGKIKRWGGSARVKVYQKATGPRCGQFTFRGWNITTS